MFYVTADKGDKPQKDMAQSPSNLVSMDDFKQVYLKQLLNDLNLTKQSFDNQINHIENHKADQLIEINHDMLRIENVLFDSIKKFMAKYKEAVVNKYEEALNTNLVPMMNLRHQLSNMRVDGEKDVEELCTLLNKETNFDDETTPKIQDLIGKCQNYNEILEKIKSFTCNVGYDDITANYSLTEETLKTNLTEARNSMNDVFAKNFSTEEFFKTMISRPRKTLSDPVTNEHSAFKVNDFKDLLKSELKNVLAMDVSSHSNHHIQSSCKVVDQFLVTGCSDCTFKVWSLNVDYFMTPMNKTIGSKVKTEDFNNPRKRAKPLKLVFTSDETFHKAYVTACTSFVRGELYNILITGDASGT